MNVDVNDADRAIYESELREWLPRRIFDAHVHLLDRSCLQPDYMASTRNCYEKFGGTFTLEQCLAWYAAMMPEQEFHLNSFGRPFYSSDLDASAAYSGGISDNRRFFGMALVSPRDDAQTVGARVADSQLIGYKPYLAFVEGKPANEVTIPDMLPADQMAVANELGLAVTLHIPRSLRLADPDNQAQMVELCESYPNTRIIFAHIGRAYYLSNVVGYLDRIAQCPNAYVDTAMVSHEGVLEYTFRNFPRDRILFGSDAPIALLRGKSVEINNQYAYLMGEDYAIGTSIYDARGAVTFTSFFFEQLRGIKLAANCADLSRQEVERIMFGNAHDLFCGIAQRNYEKDTGIPATGSQTEDLI